MVGETWDNWRDSIKRTIDLAPDSVTIYQMELPYNTVYSKNILDQADASPVADWTTKRDWVDFAFDELSAVGYTVSSGYTMVRDHEKVNFSYRDNLWRGSDLLATGIASFGHISGLHYQNHAQWDDYLGSLESGELPLSRGMRLTPHQALIREMILQLKKGWLDAAYFREKFGVEIIEHWQDQWQSHADNQLLSIEDDRITLTRTGLLQVDALLPVFFEPEHRGVRYT